MERNLIKRAKQGDKDAFLKLMNAQMQTMYKLAWTYLKNEDDVADIVYGLWDSLSDGDTVVLTKWGGITQGAIV